MLPFACGLLDEIYDFYRQIENTIGQSILLDSDVAIHFTQWNSCAEKVFFDHWNEVNCATNVFGSENFPSTSPMSDEAQKIINSVNEKNWPDFYFCLGVGRFFADVLSLLFDLNNNMHLYFNGIIFFSIYGEDSINYVNNHPYLRLLLICTRDEIDHFEDSAKVLYASQFRLLKVFHDQDAEIINNNSYADYLLNGC